MASAPTGGPVREFGALSDKELLDLLPATPEEKYNLPGTAEEKERFEEDKESFMKPDIRAILEAVWKRFYPRIQKTAEHAIWDLCPAGPSDVFVENTVDEAFGAFLRRTYRKDFSNFKGHLYTQVINVAIDARRRITKVRDNPPWMPPGRVEISVSEVKKEIPDKKQPTPEQALAASEREKIVAEREKIVATVLYEHAKRNKQSARAVRLIHIDDLPPSKIVQRVFPKLKFPGTYEERLQDLERLDKDDRKDMELSLYRFGITNARIFELE